MNSRLPLSCSVVICTKDRPSDLALCLDSLIKLKGTNHEIIVVDNAPSTSATRRLVGDYQVRLPIKYVVEGRQGLDIARNRGVREAQGEIVAFTDDDCVVDENWLDALLQNYDDPEVGCVTGLVAPWEIESRAQELFEFGYGGMGRGLLKFTEDLTNVRVTEAGMMGAGANMSFRKGPLQAIGLFNEALDCGMPTQSGGDTYAFYKVMAAGYRITYEPAAIVWHRHRRSNAHLKKQMYGYGVGVSSYLTACLVEDHDFSALLTAWTWLRYWMLRRFYRKARRKLDFPLSLLVAEFWGGLIGPFAYRRAKKIALRSQSSADYPVLVNSESPLACTDPDFEEAHESR